MAKTALPIRDICLIGIFSALNCVLAQIAIPLPFTPVPFSFGMVAVYWAGIMLRPKAAFFSQLCYLILGAVGLPVFHNLHGGFGVLLGPTGGYLIVYPFMALLISLVLNRKDFSSPEENQEKIFLILRTLAALIAAIILCYMGGSFWLAASNGISFQKAIMLGAYPFIPMDAVKIIICTVGLLPIRERLAKSHLFV